MKYCLTLADDWSAVHAASGPTLVTEGRSPAHVTVAVMIVVTQLEERKSHHIVLNMTATIYKSSRSIHSISQMSAEVPARDEDVTQHHLGKQPGNIKLHVLPLTPCPWHLAWHSSALRKDALRHSPLKQIFERERTRENRAVPVKR